MLAIMNQHPLFSLLCFLLIFFHRSDRRHQSVRLR